MIHFNCFPLSLEWNWNSQEWPDSLLATVRLLSSLHTKLPHTEVFIYLRALQTPDWISLPLCSWLVGFFAKLGLFWRHFHREVFSDPHYIKSTCVFFLCVFFCPTQYAQNLSWVQQLACWFNNCLLSQWALRNTGQRSWPSRSFGHQHSTWYRVFAPWNT